MDIITARVNRRREDEKIQIEQEFQRRRECLKIVEDETQTTDSSVYRNCNRSEYENHWLSTNQ